MIKILLAILFAVTTMRALEFIEEKKEKVIVRRECALTYNVRWEHQAILQIKQIHAYMYEADLADAVKAWNDVAGYEVVKIKVVNEFDKSLPYIDFVNDTTGTFFKSQELGFTEVNGLSQLNNTSKIFINMKHDYWLKNQISKKKTSLYNVLVHEVGHFIGLKHIEKENSNKIMNPSIKVGARQKLAPESVEAAKCLYR